jgi:protein MPE1
MMNNGPNAYPMNNGMMNSMNGGSMMPNNPMINGGPGNNFAMQQPFGHFPNQQKTVFSEPFPSEEDSPYMRKPVNPHRHARPKRIRPSDFKALGGLQSEMM